MGRGFGELCSSRKIEVHYILVPPPPPRLTFISKAIRKFGHFIHPAYRQQRQDLNPAKHVRVSGTLQLSPILQLNKPQSLKLPSQFRRQDCVSVFAWYPITWAQLVELVLKVYKISATETNSDENGDRIQSPQCCV
jgi:hypothetical protein